MTSRSRARNIYKVAVDGAYGDKPPTATEKKLLSAIALMVAEATKKPPAKKKKPKDAPKLPFGPGELYDDMLARVSDVVGLEPYNKQWFPRLGKAMQNTVGLVAEDKEIFVAWIEAGGLDFFEDVTFEHVIKHWANWIAKARKGDMPQSGGIEEYL